MKGFIFPGQGAQHVGMTKDLYESFSSAKQKFETANDILEYDLAAFCFEGPEDKLKQTYITQPAIFVHSCIVAELLAERGLEPDVVAGHSLGEYSAIVAAKALDFESALRLVKIRSQAMQDAGEKEPGTMAALLGLSTEAVTEVCEKAASAGVVTAANFNAPGQVVISGEEKGIAAAIELAKEAGARKAVQLVVGGAFHSPLMKGAQEKLHQALEEADFNDARVPVFQNSTATAVTDSGELKANLDAQLTSPVRWVECIEGMVERGVEQFWEPGPGKVLSGLLRRINRSMQSTNIGTADDLAKIG